MKKPLFENRVTVGFDKIKKGAIEQFEEVPIIDYEVGNPFIGLILEVNDNSLKLFRDDTKEEVTFTDEEIGYRYGFFIPMWRYNKFEN